MSSSYGSIINQKSYKKPKNLVFQLIKPSSFNSNKYLKFPTSETTTTMIETPRTEINENEINIFIGNFFKNKFLTLEQNPEEESLNDNNTIIHKWYVLINVIVAIVHMKNIRVKRLCTSNFSEIFNTKEKKEFKDDNLKEKKDSEIENKEMKYVLDQIKLFQLIEYGYDTYEKEIIELLKKNNFVNEPNYQDFTPLFVACLNGHENIVKILIDNGANFLLLNSNNESILDVSVRWNYYNLTKFLLFYCKWPYIYIRNAYKLIKNKKIKQLFRIYRNNNISCLH